MKNSDKSRYLAQYIEVTRELDEVQEFYNAKRFDLQSPILSDMPTSHSQTPDKIGNSLCQYAELVDRIKGIINRLSGKINEIEGIIETVEDSLHRRILRKKYLEGKTFRQISLEVFCSIKTAKRKHNEVLKLIDIKDSLN